MKGYRDKPDQVFEPRKQYFKWLTTQVESPVSVEFWLRGRIFVEDISCNLSAWEMPIATDWSCYMLILTIIDQKRSFKFILTHPSSSPPVCQSCLSSRSIWPSRTGSRICSRSSGISPWTCPSSQNTEASRRTSNFGTGSNIWQIQQDIPCKAPKWRSSAFSPWSFRTCLFCCWPSVPARGASLSRNRGPHSQCFPYHRGKLYKSRYTLLYTEVSVDRCVSGSSCQIFALSVRNVLSISLDVSFGQSEVDDEHFVTGLVDSHTEVVRFDVSVEEMSVVDVLYPVDHLVNNHQNCLEGKFSEGVLEQRLQGGTH